MSRPSTTRRNEVIRDNYCLRCNAAIKIGELYCDVCWPVYQAVLSKHDYVGRHYRDSKTGNTYRVLAYPALLERDDIAGPEHVVYESLSTGVVWIRLASEFFDGRFVEVSTTDGRQESKEEL